MKNKKIVWKKENGRYIEIDVRNVGDKNPEAQIQIEVTDRRIDKRTKNWSLCIPSEKVNEFIQALQ